MNKPREKTIDAYGNIINKPYGSSRWISPKKFDCAHDECDHAAVVLKTNPVHNCCNQHEHEDLTPTTQSDTIT